MTEILPIYTYRVAFMGTCRIGQGAAISTIILLINLTLALIYLKMLKRK
jgi:multiple sugar transport system permease protein